MSIRRLMALTAYLATTFTMAAGFPLVGLVLTSLIPAFTVTVVYKLASKRPRIAIGVSAALPVYIALSGPALAIALAVRQTSASGSMLGYRVHQALYPDVVFWNPDYLVGRQLILYTHWWYELAGG